MSSNQYDSLRAAYRNGWEEGYERYSRDEVQIYVKRMTDTGEDDAAGGHACKRQTTGPGRKRHAAKPQLHEEDTIIADGVYYPFNDYMHGINDNILVVGGSGVGKTRSIVRPNILQATGSYIISDPKGNLYDLYHSYLRDKGYRVERLDFVNPRRSTVRYNFFSYIHNQTDILKIANMLCGNERTQSKDRFWDQSAQILIQACISYLYENSYVESADLGAVMDLLHVAQRSEPTIRSQDYTPSQLDKQFEAYAKENPNSMTARCYASISMNPVRTWNCVVSMATSMYGAFDTEEVRDLVKEDSVHLDQIGSRKTALFVVVSDTDRSMDLIANIFFSQAMQELCRVADARANNRLAVPVRFILDDFATNVHIDQFPRMISSIRSRAISTMLMVQAEAQLRSGYDDDAETVISNCDTYVYLGGNDVNTAENVGRRCDRRMLDILNMPVGSCWVFRRGQKAISAEIFQLDPFERKCLEEASATTPPTSSHTRVRRTPKK